LYEFYSIFVWLFLPPGARVTASQAFNDWWYGRTRGGADSLYIDSRSPNGGGSYNGTADPFWKHCQPFNMPGMGSPDQ
jgi:hypothetical protein